MSELVVFTQRENFDFLKFPYWYPTKQKEELKAECTRVQQSQKETAQSFGGLALRLVYLRDIGGWEDILNPETATAFGEKGFGAFCKHAFGLSPTLTSNLLGVAQFIIEHGDERGLLREEYRGYDFSKLVELSSVAPSNRGYFNPDMTVKEIRTAKNYMKMGGFFEDKNNADFDLLTYSTAFEEERKLGADAKKTNPEVIPGQIDLEDISDSIKMDVIPTSELANAGEEDFTGELTEGKKERAIKKALIEQAGRNRRKEIYDKYKENPPHNKFVQFIKDSYWRSGFIVDGISGDADAYGYSIRFIRHNWTLLFSWAQVTSLIVGFINRGEYYTEENVIPTSQVANAGEDEIDIYDMPMQTHSFDSDEYDEEDEAQADMQAEMQTIEQDSEKSLPEEEYDCCEVQKGVAPWLKPDFKNRDGIREFYQAYMSWEQLYCRVPCIEVYRYKFKIGTLYAVKGRVAGILEPRESREIKYSVRYFWQDKGDWLCCETPKEHLEKFISLHKDEM